MIIIHYVCQLVICGFLLFIVVAFIRSIRKNKWENAKRTIYEAVITFSVFIIVLILINVCFLVAKKNNFMGESVLEYSEAQQMIVSALVAGCIAFFQFKIQNAIEDRNQKESRQREEFHIKEIKSERIKEMQIYSELSAYALNFNILNCRVIYEKQYNRSHEAKFFIRIFADNERKQIYPHYFKQKDKYDEGECWINAKVIDIDENNYECEIFPEYIDISFVNGFDKLNYFFTAPTLVDEEQAALTVNITFNGIDTSYDDDEYSEFKFFLEFQLVSCNGYDNDGKFDIKIIKPLISIHPNKKEK